MGRTIPIALAALVTLPALAACQRGGLPEDGLSGDHFVVDAAGLIENESEQRMNEILGGVLDDTDIELVAVAVDSLDGEPINDFTNALFERWEVGSRTLANRGVLLVIGREEEQVRFEVAYDLEPVFTDAFVSYIEHEQMVPFFANDEVGRGIEATVELIARQAYEKVLGQAYDPTAEGDSDIGGFRTGGAGAETTVTFGDGVRGRRPPADETVRSHFAAQPTPELAWDRFVEANRRRIKDPELGIYDREAKKFMRGVVTNAGQDHLANLYESEEPTVRTEGDRAVILFLNDPNHLLAPWFFHKTREGWQLDGSMYPDVIGYNHLNQWRFRRRDHDYMFAFSDFRLDENGFAFYRP
jgi:uncharacterized protein